MNNKGSIVPIIVVAMVGAVVLVAIAVNTLIVDSKALNSSGKEIEVIETIDSMEFLKLSLRNSVGKSVNKATYDTLSKGGYYVFQEPLNVRNCEPYWRVYEKNFIPSDNDVEKNLKDAILDIFNCYGQQYSNSYSNLGMLIDLPEYNDCGSVDILSDDESYSFLIRNDCNSGLKLSKGN